MVVEAFPPVDAADEYGLLAIGGDLDVDSLLLAYKSGVFPWPIERRILTWFAPPRRAILRLEDFHVPRSLKREFKRREWTFSIDQAFPEVIKACAQSKNRKGQRGTWIIPPMVKAYLDLHRSGYAHSVECWFQGELSGGLYGVALGRMFAGESMFYNRPNASKLAVCHLVEELKRQEVEWLDCQVMTPLFKSFGAVEVTREDFMKMLAQALRRPDIKLEQNSIAK
jgi:leucyl/phenylalanyl-tRNA---protein transferase